MSRKSDKWRSARGIMDELHRIREELHQDEKRLGREEWIREINQSSRRLGFKIPKKSSASS
jgi:hypothetical protein